MYYFLAISKKADIIIKIFIKKKKDFPISLSINIQGGDKMRLRIGDFELEIDKSVLISIITFVSSSIIF